MPPAQRNHFLATVVSNTLLCREHYRLTLQLVRFPPTAPGQFVQIACRPVEEAVEGECEFEWNEGRSTRVCGRNLVAPGALLRRPFSLAGRRDIKGYVELDVIHRVVGVGTQWLSHLSAGEQVSLIGPLGNRFELPPEGCTAILVAGGVGIPPMLYLAEKLKGRAVAFVGATSHDLLPVTISAYPVPTPTTFTPARTVAEFARFDIASTVSTDDGSYGFRGYVTQALEGYLDSICGNPRASVMIYTCGPEPMMKRVAEIARSRSLPCQVAVERSMACGLGTCQSCVIRVHKPDARNVPLPGNSWCYRLACTDGPIFNASDLLW